MAIQKIIAPAAMATARARAAAERRKKGKDGLSDNRAFHRSGWLSRLGSLPRVRDAVSPACAKTGEHFQCRRTMKSQPILIPMQL